MTSNWETRIVPGAKVGSQSFWPALHELINDAFAAQRLYIFPRSWQRLNPDVVEGGRQLSNELGPEGYMVVAFENHKPIACAAFLPFDTGVGHTPEACELLCVATAVSHQRRGLSSYIVVVIEKEVRRRGAKKLVATYVEMAMGPFWRSRGFETVPDRDKLLAKGFTLAHIPDCEPLEDHVLFRTGAKQLT